MSCHYVSAGINLPCGIYLYEDIAQRCSLDIVTAKYTACEWNGSVALASYRYILGDFREGRTFMTSLHVSRPIDVQLDVAKDINRSCIITQSTTIDIADDTSGELYRRGVVGGILSICPCAWQSSSLIICCARSGFRIFIGNLSVATAIFCVQSRDR